MRGGGRSSIDSMVESNPKLEPELRDLLPVIERLEDARQSHLRRPAGLATLGASRPQRLGDFELVRQIGRGGMGVVFEAMQESLGRTVALKVLPTNLLTDGGQLKRFEREARMAASLHHTNIVPVFGVGEDHGFHYYVMQRIEAKGLDRFVADRPSRLTPKQVAILGRQAASALAYAHQQNVMHRDIKPANLLANDQFDLWVTDFGVAKAIESDAVTRTGDVIGTLRYMAPEQLVGETDPRSDIYSLGVTLYELLAGRPAVDDESIRASIVSRRAAPSPPRLRQLNPDVPADLETILETAMSIDPESRYQTAEDLENDLKSFLEGDPISVRPLSLFQQAWRWIRRNPAVASLSALSLLLLCSVALLSSIGLLQLRSAFAREQQNREDAEQIASVASRALDHVFQSFTGVSGSGGTATGEFGSNNLDSVNLDSIDIGSIDANVDADVDVMGTPALSSEAAELLEDLLVYYDEIADHSGLDPKLQQSAIDAQYAVGDIHFKLGHYDRAIQSFSRILATSDPTSGMPVVSQLQIARLHNRIGFAYRISGDDRKADAEHQIALDLLVALQESDTNPDPSVQQSRSIRFQLARTHSLLAAQVLPGMGPSAMPSVELIRSFRPPMGPAPIRRPDLVSTRNRRSADRLEQDRNHADAATGLLEKLIQEDPSQVRYSLALAQTLRHRDRVSRARDNTGASKESIELLRQLHADHPQDDTVLFDLSEALADDDLRGANRSVEQMQLQIGQLEEAVANFATLSDANPYVPKYINATAHAHFKLAMIREQLAGRSLQEKERELERLAGVSLRQAVDRYAALLKQHPEAPGYRAWYALFLFHDGGNAFQSHAYQQAVDSYTQSVVEWLRLIQTHPESEISWAVLPATYRALGETYWRQGESELADNAFDEEAMSRIYFDLTP